MDSQQRQLIRGLIKRYSTGGTESFIAYVAETTGMLAACQALLQSLDTEDSTSAEWLQRECSDNKLIFNVFLQEVQRTMALFQPSRHGEDYHAILGVSVHAGPEEIKHAYRTLCRRYHPDTAAPPYRNNPEKFIAINKAYSALSRDDGKGEIDEAASQEKRWRRKKVRTVSSEQRKKVVVWTLGLLVLLVVISTFASMSYKKRAMLAGLQQSRGTLISSSRKMVDDSVDKRQGGGNQSMDFPLKSSQTEREAKLSREGAEPLATGPSTLAGESSNPHQSEGNRPHRTGEMEDKASAVVIPHSRGDSEKVKTVTAQNTFAVVSTDGVERTKQSKRKTSTEPRAASGISTKAVSRVSGPKAGIKAVAEKYGDTSIPLATKEKKTLAAAVAVTETMRQPDRDVEVPTPHWEKSVGPSPAATANSRDNKTLPDVELTNVSVNKLVPPSVSPSRTEDQSQVELDLQARVDRFFTDYIHAYEQRNPMLFAKFFDVAAKENGKPFATMLPVYLDLFATTELISFQVQQRTWKLVDGRVAVDGQFKVILEYADRRKISGSGPIHFLLTENGNELLVKEMKYVFNTK